MPEKIHYDNNIYFLATLIHALSDALRLNVDAEFFADKILEDTLFIDSSIQRMYGLLNANTQLVLRASYIHSVMKLKHAYVGLVEALLSTEGALRPSAVTTRARLRKTITDHLSDIKSMRGSLENVHEAGSDIISNEEFHYLMSPID